MSYINNFGFGAKTGIDLNGESNGILFNIDKMGPVELATTSFGQGISVTPIQQVTAVSAAINGGTLYEPFLVKEMLEPETKSVIYTKETCDAKKSYQRRNKQTSQICSRKRRSKRFRTKCLYRKLPCWWGKLVQPKKYKMEYIWMATISYHL